MKNGIGIKYSDFVLYLTLVLIGLFSVFYYQAAWGWPVIDSYPQVERLMDSNYLSNDFYTNTFEDFSPRLYLSYFYIFGADLFKIKYSVFIGYLNLLRIFLLSISIYTLFRVLSENKYVALIGTFIGSVSFYSVPKIVAWFFSKPVFSNAEFALVFIIFGLALLYRRKVSLAFILFSVAMLLHPVITIHGLLLGGMLSIPKIGLRNLSRVFNLRSFLSIGLLMTAFLLSYIPYENSLKGYGLLSSEEFTNINAILRHPHHFISSTFGMESWLVFMIYMVTMVYMVVILRSRLPKSLLSFFKMYAMYLPLVVAAGYLFVEVIPVKSVVTLMPYRSFVFIPLIYLFVYSFYMHYKFLQKDYLSFVLLHIPYIPILTNDLEVSTLAVIIAFIYSGVTDFLNSKNIKLSIYIDQYIFRKIDIKYLYLILISIAIATSYQFLDKKFTFNIPEVNAHENQVYSWLKENTSEDAIVYSEISVDYLVNEKIRLLAERAIPISKDFPFNEKYYKEWSQRYIHLYNGIYENDNYVNNLTSEELYQLSQQYQFEYILRTKELKKNQYFNLENTLKLRQRTIYIYSSS